MSRSSKRREAERDHALRESRTRAEAWFGPVDLPSLAALAGDPDPRERRLALALMQREIHAGRGADDAFVALARTLVGDPDNICRWQALFVVVECMDGHVDEAWSVVREHGGSRDEDMRAAVACVLFEHLLDEHFDEVFPRLREELLKGSAEFAAMVGFCWFDHNEGPRYRRLQQLLRTAARGRPKAG